MIEMLKTQLPIISPSAILGVSAIATELMPVISSGRDVTLAMRMSPIHALPSPVFSAIISPYLESLMPQKTITAEQKINSSHTMSILNLLFLSENYKKQPQSHGDTEIQITMKQWSN